MQTDYGMSASVTQKVVLWVSEDGWCRGEGLQKRAVRTQQNLWSSSSLQSYVFRVVSVIAGIGVFTKTSGLFCRLAGDGHEKLRHQLQDLIHAEATGLLIPDSGDIGIF